MAYHTSILLSALLSISSILTYYCIVLTSIYIHLSVIFIFYGTLVDMEHGQHWSDRSISKPIDRPNQLTLRLAHRPRQLSVTLLLELAIVSSHIYCWRYWKTIIRDIYYTSLNFNAYAWVDSFHGSFFRSTPTCRPYLLELLGIFSA
jgi:hypothetical protein